ncbi:hypothetical protein COOONC_04394 [Cooperia oncophora]
MATGASGANGLSHIEEVISLVFNYTGLLRRSGVIAWVHEELQKIGEIQFRFMEKDDPIHAAETLSSALQRIPFQDVLSWKVLTECKPGTAQIPSLNALCKRILHLKLGCELNENL